MVCLDSDILISFLRGDTAAVEKVSVLKQGNEGPLRTTVVNVYELIKGARLGSMKEENEVQVRRLISEMEILGLDSEACESGASIFSHLKERGTMVNELDILIAGMVVANRDKLVSRDGGFRRMPGLRVDEW